MRLDNLEVHSCCYFISLRTGTKIFGFISLVCCLWASLHNVLDLTMLVAHDDEDGYTKWMIVTEVVALSVQMATSVVLLLGAYQEKAKLILPWLVSTFISAVLEVSLFPPLAHVTGNQHDSVTEWIIFTIFMLCDDIYGLLVVFSYYRSLSQRQQNVV